VGRPPQAASGVALPLGTAAVLLFVLFLELARPRLRRTLTRVRMAAARARRAHAVERYDPGRERRAEQRARALLRSCVNEEDWEIYRDLGFLRVLGPVGAPAGEAPAPYAYLIYPHKPIVAYVPATGELLSEYCITFPDHTRPFGSSRLPHSDDVLAKWMAITADERRLIGEANMHLPGRQVDPERVRRDLARLARWERERGERELGGARAA
jgi:hypothetical protein